MIAVNNLTFCYRRDLALFENVTFSIPAPGFYSIFGKSGSGKSTIGKIIACRVTDLGAGAVSVPKPALYASSDDLLPNWTLVAHHLQQFLPDGVDTMLQSYWQAAKLGEHVFNSFPSQLSLGERQRVNLARYVVRCAPCLVLDEVLVGVDQPTRWEILKWLKSVRRNMTTIFISHEIEDVATFSKQILKLDGNGSTHIRFLNGDDLDEVNPEASARHTDLRLELARS